MTHPIILDVCKNHRITLADFFGPTRHQTIVLARIEALSIFIGEKRLSLAATARILRRHRTTIQYWLSVQSREHRREYMRKRWHAKYKHEARA